MILRSKPMMIDAIRFVDLEQGIREPWVSVAICAGRIWMQGGPDPFWTVETPSGRVQMRDGDWLVRHPDGGLFVYTDDEIWARFEYYDPAVVSR